MCHNFKVRLLHKCLINCSSGLRDLNRNATLHPKHAHRRWAWNPRPPSVGVEFHALHRWAWNPRPPPVGVGSRPPPVGVPKTPGRYSPTWGRGLDFYLRPSGRVRARSSSRVYARYNSVRLLGRTTRRPAPSSYESPVRRRTARFISAARLTNVPVLCAHRAIWSQSSAQGQVNRSVHHHHRSESRKVF